MTNLKSRLPLILGLVGAGLVATNAPAHAVAIQYNFQNVTIPSNQVVTGTFFYDSSLNQYTNWSISLPSTSASAITYNPSTSSIILIPSSTSVIFSYTSPFPSSPANTNSRNLALEFQSTLGPLGSTTLFDVTNPLPRSGEFIVADNGATEVNRFFTTGSSVVGVPLETDALPVVGMSVIVGGMFWLRRRKRSQVTLNLIQSGVTQDA